MSDVAARLRDVSAAHLHLPAAQLVAGASLVEDLGLDSLALIEWGMVLEDELAISLPEEAWRDLATYGDLERLVVRLAEA